MEAYHLGARRSGHLWRPRDGARFAPGLQARERTGPLDELHGHRERELRGAARQGPGGPVGAPLTGIAKAYFRPGLRFGNLRLGPGTYRFQIDLAALTNPARTTTLTSPTFRIGTPARAGRGGSHARPAPRYCKGHRHGKHRCGRR